MLKLITKISIFVCLLSAINPVFAGRVDALYDVKILVADESSSTREKAFKQGLDEIFIRISGDSTVMEKLKSPPARRYVKQFSYEPIDNTGESASGNPATSEKEQLLTHRLNIIYNGRAVEKYLLENGYAVWGEYRPDVVIWLNVRDGRNDYVLKDDDQSLIKASLSEAMTRRGVPVLWPAYDQKDKKILTISDIKGGFKDPVMKASKRYSRGPALAGSMTWNGKQWRSSWDLLMEGENKHWSLSDIDHNKLINKSIDQVANALGAVFAVHTADNKQQLAHIWLDLQAVKTVDDYRYVENYLANLSAVEKVKPARVDGQNAVFEILLRSNEEDFLNLIKNDAELTELDATEIKKLLGKRNKAEQTDTEDAGTDQSGANQPGINKDGVDKGSNDKSSVNQASNLEEQTPASNSTPTQAINEKNTGGNLLGTTPNAAAGGGKGSDTATGANTQQVVDINNDSLEKAEAKHIYYYRLDRSR